MCELFAMSASVPHTVCYELDLFAAEGGEKHRNRDGWGILIFPKTFNLHFQFSVCLFVFMCVCCFVLSFFEGRALTIVGTMQPEPGDCVLQGPWVMYISAHQQRLPYSRMYEHGPPFPLWVF